jgi:hypothetical protein
MDHDSLRRSTSLAIRELVRLGGSCSARRIMSNIYLSEQLVLLARMKELIASDDDFSDGEYRQAGWFVDWTLTVNCPELGTYPLLQSVLGTSVTALQTSFHKVEFNCQDNENRSLIQRQLNMLVKWPVRVTPSYSYLYPEISDLSSFLLVLLLLQLS